MICPIADSSIAGIDASCRLRCRNDLEADTVTVRAKSKPAAHAPPDRAKGACLRSPAIHLGRSQLRGRRNGGTVACGAGPASHKRGKGWHCINTVCPSAVTLPRANLHFRREAMAIEIPLLSTIKKESPSFDGLKYAAWRRPPGQPGESKACRLLHEDLDAAVLWLAHTVAGLHQQALLAGITVIAYVGTPSRTRASFTAFARRRARQCRRARLRGRVALSMRGQFALQRSIHSGEARCMFPPRKECNVLTCRYACSALCCPRADGRPCSV